MALPGLATHTLAGLYALRLSSGASTTGNLQHSAKPQQPPHITCPSRPHPVQAPPNLLHAAETAVELAVAHGIPRAGLHTLAGLCALRLLSSASTTGKLKHSAKPHATETTYPALLQQPLQGPPHLLRTLEAAFALAVAHGMPRAGHSYTGRYLCTVAAKQCLHRWKLPAFSKPTPPTNPRPSSPAVGPRAGSATPDANCRGCIWPCGGP